MLCSKEAHFDIKIWLQKQKQFTQGLSEAEPNCVCPWRYRGDTTCAMYTIVEQKILLIVDSKYCSAK